MRHLSAVLLLAALAGEIGYAQASEGFPELSTLAKTGASEEALGVFVQKSPVAYDLTVDEIFFLSDLGYSSKIIAAIVEHGKALRGGTAAQATAVNNPETQPPPKADENRETIAQNDAPKPNGDPTTDNPPVDPNVQVTTPPPEATLAKKDAPDQDPAALQNGPPNNPNPIDVIDPNGGNTASNPQPIDPRNPQPVLPGQENGGLTLTSGDGTIMHVEETVTGTGDVPTVVAPPADDATVGVFYETLLPYGTWVRLDGAWYWRPTACVTDPDWRPYCDRGHWNWTDNNWCWQSDYSWGWAPFHYGRWARCDGYGWLWQPDTCWSPAWVSWRECDGYYGWGALPPSAHYRFGMGFHFGGRYWNEDCGFGLGCNDYCFCESAFFCDFSLRGHVLHRRDNNRIFYQSHTIRNNVTLAGNHVIVNGPHFDHVQKYSSKPIVQMHIADANIKAGDSLGRASREDRHNGTLSLYRPTLKTTTTITPVAFSTKNMAVLGSTTAHVDGIKLSPTSSQTRGSALINTQGTGNQVLYHNTASGNTGTPGNQFRPKDTVKIEPTRVISPNGNNGGSGRVIIQNETVKTSPNGNPGANGNTYKQRETVTITPGTQTPSHTTSQPTYQNSQSSQNSQNSQPSYQNSQSSGSNNNSNSNRGGSSSNGNNNSNSGSSRGR